MRTLVLILVLSVPLSASLLPAPAQAQSDSTYVVKSGDTLYSIARAHGVSVRALMRWNDLESPSLQEGQTIRIRPPAGAAPTDTGAADTTRGLEADTTNGPPPSPPDTAAVDTTAPPPYGEHIVEQGDTFVSLALRLGTTADTLFALNDRTTDSLLIGRTLRLPRRFGPPTHVVKNGETLYSIAGQHGASVRALRAVNDLDTTDLQPGRRLRLPHDPEMPPSGTWAAPDTVAPVSVYPEAFAGRLTASGRTYNPDDHVVSHPSLPFGSVVLLSRPDEDMHSFARVLDRGPAEENSLLDISAAVAQRLGIDPGSPTRVALRVVWTAE